MEITFLGCQEFDNQDKNYGDCILLDDGNKLVIYDCGSDELADKVIHYMNEKGYDKVDVVLSHNDKDHYKGLDKLRDEGKIAYVTTLLLFKYADEILEILDDDRRTKAGVIEKTKEDFDNIASLSGCNLKDALSDECFLSDSIRIVGPDKDYVLNAVAKQINEAESDTLDYETITNAISLQVEVDVNGKMLLLTGDAPVAAFDVKIQDYDMVQLPHHGNKNHAEDIFNITKKKTDMVYYVSDNTGNTNGGSDGLQELDTCGLIIHNTKNTGDILVNEESTTRVIKGTLGI